MTHQSHKPLTRRASWRTRNVREFHRFLLPLCCLASRRGGLTYSGQLLIRQPLTKHRTSGLSEALSIVAFPFVEPERLFVNIAKQVVGFHGNIGSLDAPFQQGSKIFQPIGMYHLVFDVGFGMIYKLVDILRVQPTVSSKSISEQLRA